jgi:hypothetical protein
MKAVRVPYASKLNEVQLKRLKTHLSYYQTVYRIETCADSTQEYEPTFPCNFHLTANDEIFSSSSTIL